MNRNLTLSCFVFIVLLWSTAGMAAEMPSSEATGYLEFGGSYYGLSSHFPSWSDFFVRGVLKESETNTWSGEAWNQRRFGDQGWYYAAGLSHDFSEDWYADVHVGSSLGGFFLPRLRTDGFINKKWLTNKQLVTSLGMGYYKYKDTHHDVSYFFGAHYYFHTMWLAEGGIRLNDSSPGRVLSTSQFLAMTYGADKKQFITLRGETGHEAYLIIGPHTALNNFSSNTISLTYRKWMAQRWGVNLTAEHYKNPSYQRNGLEAGIFAEF